MNIFVDQEEQLDFQDILIAPRPSEVQSRKDVDITKKYTFKHSGKEIVGSPVIAANMISCGTFEIARHLQKHKMFTALHKYYDPDEVIKFLEKNKQEFGNNDYIIISSGIRQGDFERMKRVLDTGLCDKVRLDCPNGYISNFTAHINKVRHYYPDLIIFAGNVVTCEKTRELISKGADVAVNGIGGGAQCLSRQKAGIGRPQFSMLADCIYPVRQEQAYLCSDGGITCPGDIAKALAVSDFVMIGSMFGTTEEADGRIIERQKETGYLINGKPEIITQQFKEVFGTSSSKAQEVTIGKVAEYRASEGRVLEAPVTGSIEDVVKDIEGGLRSCATYVGARNIDEMQQSIKFYKVRRQLNTNLVNKSIKSRD